MLITMITTNGKEKGHGTQNDRVGNKWLKEHGPWLISNLPSAQNTPSLRNIRPTHRRNTQRKTTWRRVPSNCLSHQKMLNHLEREGDSFLLQRLGHVLRRKKDRASTRISMVSTWGKSISAVMIVHMNSFPINMH